MSLYSELPVFKDTYSLILAVYAITKEFPREYKYSLGQEMKRDAMTLVRSIYRANRSRSKKEFLEEFLDGFFMHIDKPLLNRRLHDFIEEQYFGDDKLIVMRLCRQIIDRDPTRDCLIKGRRSDWKGLPPSKSLFGVPRDKGLPIGNLTSQMFANFYLDALDKYITRTLGIKYYGRYVDDFVIVHRDREFLKSVIPKIAAFLRENLLLRLHPRKVYLQHYAHGVKYIGAVIKGKRIYISNRTKGNCWQAIERHNSVVNGHRPSENEIRAFQASVNSYFGLMRPYRTYNIKKKMKRRFSGYWWNHIVIRKGYVSLRRRPVRKPPDTFTLRHRPPRCRTDNALRQEMEWKILT